MNPRLLGLALAVVVGIALVALFTMIFGSDDSTTAASAAPVSAIVTTAQPAAETLDEPTTTTLPTTTLPTTTLPTTTVPPTTTTLPPVSQNHVFVMGDSVLLGAAEEIPAALPGWNVIVDAKVSRFLNQGIEVLQARRAEIGAGGVVVIQQGNNYLGSEQQFREEIDQTMAVLAGVPKVVWITVSEFTRSRVDVNREILDAAERYPNIVLADWNGIWLANRAFTSHDGLHLKAAGQSRVRADGRPSRRRAPRRPEPRQNAECSGVHDWLEGERGAGFEACDVGYVSRRERPPRSLTYVLGVLMKKHGMARLFAGAGLAVSVLAISEGAQAAPAGTQSATTEAAACAALYGVPANVGPEPLSACQWDMRAIGATSAGSYAMNRGAGAARRRHRHRAST